MKKYERFMEAHPEVNAWLKNRPESTKKVFASRLERFCKAMKVTPERWRRLDKFEARDLDWKYVEPKIREHSAVAQAYLTALKSWFRNLNGETLPFDSSRGGKHYIHVVHPKRAKEHIPNKTEMYQIIDMASSLRDKALLLFLFQAGVRVNVAQHITYGDVQSQLNEGIIMLKITGDLDYKLRGRDIPFYYTFLNGEGEETLRRFCKVDHKNSKSNTPLFYTQGNKAVSQPWIWRIVKNCVRKAGFDRETISTHTIRKAFRKIVRQANIDDDDKEQLMGHAIRGSRQAYYDKKDVKLIREAYEKCNFTREIPQSEMTKLRQQLEEKTTQMLSLEKRVELLEEYIKKAIKPS